MMDMRAVPLIEFCQVVEKLMMFMKLRKLMKSILKIILKIEKDEFV